MSRLFELALQHGFFKVNFGSRLTVQKSRFGDLMKNNGRKSYNAQTLQWSENGLCRTSPNYTPEKNDHLSDNFYFV